MMAQPNMNKSTLSVLENLSVGLKLAKSLGAGFVSLCTETAPWGRKTQFFLGFARTIVDSVSVRQVQGLFPSDEEAYLACAKTHHFEPFTESLEGTRARLHWIGSRDAPNVIFLIHGGGYVMSGTTQAEWTWQLLQETDIMRQELAVALLDYSFVPGASWPEQLKEAARALEYLTVRLGKRPEDIVVWGDSGGGNLALALLSHLLHPHPAVPKLELSGALAGVALVSPWVKPKSDCDSMKRNHYTDTINKGILDWMAENFLAGSAEDEYNSPLTAAPEWWDGIQSVAMDIIVTGGRKETMIDDIEAFAAKLKSAMPSMKALFPENEMHEHALAALIMGLKTKCESSKMLKQWTIGKFKG